MSVKQILERLVEFDTYKDNQNKEILDYIQRTLEAKGFKTEYRSKCLVMSINQVQKIGFLGHTDTVKCGNNWIYDPYKLTEIDNKLYGLGVCDMKGGIAAVIQAVIDIDWNKLDYGIKLFFTYDEEIGFRGIKEICNSGLVIPNTMIIGEPTDNEVLSGSKGLLEFKIELDGKSAHSSNPQKGVNAIEKCMLFLNELNEFYLKMQTEVYNQFEIPYSTMNIGKISGGTSINVVPDKCEVYIDFRIINNEHRSRIINKLNELKGKYQFSYNLMNDIKPFITDIDGKTSNFITEASFIDVKNRYILGVGPVNPHEANEYITIESLEKLVDQYKKIISTIKKS